MTMLPEQFAPPPTSSILDDGPPVCEHCQRPMVAHPSQPDTWTCDHGLGAIAREIENDAPPAAPVGAKSKATTPNPKDLFGNKKVSLTKVPSVAIAHCAMAMMDGAEKYGPYNWRDKAIIGSIYIDAAMRHLMDWFEGQKNAKDSGVHHLGHAMACCAILLDAEENEVLLDDRPICGNPDLLDKLLDRLSEDIVARRARLAEMKAKAEAGA